MVRTSYIFVALSFNSFSPSFILTISHTCNRLSIFPQSHNFILYHSKLYKPYVSVYIVSIINYIAPEHIEILQKNYKKYLKDINNAGSICIGNYSSMALSDYGPTQHTLPTSGSAKFSSGLGVREFIKQISYNELSKKGVAKLGKSGYLLSNFEDLKGHSKSIKIRMRGK